MYRSNKFGRIFWVDEDLEFRSCPLNVDGTGDFTCEDYVSEWTDWEGVDFNKLFYIHHLEIINKNKFGNKLTNSDYILTEEVYKEVKKCYNDDNLEDNYSYIDSLLTTGIWHGN